jgi:hypothetical protein
LLRLCREAADEATRTPNRLRKKETALRNRVWTWCRGPLRARIVQRLIALRPGLAHEHDELYDTTDFVVGIFWRRMNQAVTMYEAARTKPPQHKAQDLDPRVALQRSIEAAIRVL